MRYSFTGPLAAVLLASCASLPPERGEPVLRELARDRTGYDLPVDADARAAAADDARARLARPLRVDDAVAIALANSPEIDRALAELGLTYADLIEASRVSNPSLGLSALDSNEPGTRTQVGISIVQSFGDAILLRSRSRIARGEFESAQQEAVRKVQELIAGTTGDYFRALGARQVAAMRRVVATAARASATLSARYFAAGNIPALDDDLRQAEALEAEMEADAADAAAVAARGELAIRMGLGASDRFELADSLPLPSAALEDLDELTQVAYASRLDLAAARRRTELLAESLGVTRSFRWLGGFEVGYETERETDGSRLRGPTLSIDLPIFHQNQAALARATAQVDLAEAEARAIERDIGTRVAVAHASLGALRARIDRQRTLLLPLRARVVERTQEQVNFMLVGVFELLSARRAEYDAYQQYLESLRDYWVARAELSLAVGRVLAEPAANDDAPGVSAIVLPAAPAAMDHSGHDMGHGKAMDHSGHDMGGDEKTDHAGHDMHAAPADGASDGDAEAPHHEHEGHAP